MKHLVWALLCVGCGGDRFSADTVPDGGAKIMVGGEPSVWSDGGAGAPSAGNDGSTGGMSSVSDLGGSGGALGGAWGETGGFGGDGATAGMRPDGGSGGATGVSPVDAGDVALGGSGGSIANSGGAGGCSIVTHDNGLGQMWQDCAPRGTYNVDQATKACEASGAPRCELALACPEVNLVCGYNATMTTCFGGCWSFQGVDTGTVQPNCNTCSWELSSAAGWW